MRKPWFQVLEVFERGGRSMADIAAEVVSETGVSLLEMRGFNRTRAASAARRKVYRRIRDERPDLTSGEVGVFMRKDGSTIRRVWRTEARSDAA